MNYLICSLLIILIPAQLLSQSENNDLFALIEEVYISDQTDELDIIVEEVLRLKENKLEINSEYESIPVLNDFQKYGISKYVKQYGRLLTFNELYFIPGFNEKTIKLLEIICYIGNQKHSEFKAKKATILTRSFYNSSLKNQEIIGKPYNFLLKNSFEYGKIEVNASFENDYGEELFYRSNKFTDFYSGNISYTSNKLKIILGDYNIGFGNNVAFGKGNGSIKTTSISQLFRSFKGIRPYTSSNEFQFLRGAVFEKKLNKSEVSIFISNKRTDATINELGIASSLLNTGYHNTPALIEKEKNFEESLIGSYFNTNFEKCDLGILLAYSNYSNEFEYYSIQDKFPQKTLKSNFISSLFYNYRFNKSLWFNELSFSQFRYPAIYSGLIGYLNPFSLYFSVRHFSPDYYSRYSTSIKSSSYPSNETGFLWGTEFEPYKDIKLSFYYDYYINKNMSYTNNSVLNTSSDFKIKIDYRFSDKSNIYFRFSERKSPDSYTFNNTKAKEDYIKTQFRINFEICPVSYLTLRSRGETNIFKFNGFSEKGNLLYQDMNFKLQKKLNLSFRYTLYNTSSYDSRIYLFEYNVLYYSTMPAMYGEGERYSIMLKYSFLKNADLWLKYAYTKSSETEVKNEIYFQLVYKPKL